MSSKKHPLRITRTAHGIRAQSLRTLVKRAWWARRWIAMLEGMRLGPRLGRGRQYALSGQVVDLCLEGTQVTAHVQGSRPEPYLVKLDFSSPPAPGTEGAVSAALGNPLASARLLTDDLPLEIEEACSREGRSLFAPGKTWCGCPDWRKPCKHVAAVLFILGEEIARKPSLLLDLKGIDWEAALPPPESVAPPEDFSARIARVGRSGAAADAAGSGAVLARDGEVRRRARKNLPARAPRGRAPGVGEVRVDERGGGRRRHENRRHRH